MRTRVRAKIAPVTSQGSPYQRFRRALQTGNALLAWAAAHELRHINLEDSLALVLLLAQANDANFHKSASRWV